MSDRGGPFPAIPCISRLIYPKTSFFPFPGRNKICHLIHGVLIWLIASFCLQPRVLLKNHCPASPRVRERVPCPQSRPVSALDARQPWRGDPSGHSASMAARASGHAEAAGRQKLLRATSLQSAFHHDSHKLRRSSFTCAVVLSGCRAHIHIPNDRATIIADITFRSHRREKSSSW